jgi:C1A family cysteine protease
MYAQRKASYGWRRDQLDPRDRIFNLEESIAQPAALPATYDLSGEMPPVYDQEQLNSCTANATAALLQHMQMRQGEAEGANVPSRLFIYYEERRMEGQPPTADDGAQIRDGIKVLVSEGAPPESDWPYSDAKPGRYSEAPPQNVYADAVKYEAVQYKRILPGQPGAPMRTAIASHYPIVFGFTVPALFEEPTWDPITAFLPLPNAETQFVGRHAVVIVGYDFTLERFPVPVFKVRNSWGEAWGDGGHFYLHHQWFDPWRQLTDDLWVVMSVK